MKAVLKIMRDETVQAPKVFPEVYVDDLFLEIDSLQRKTSPNSRLCLQQWQPAITFHNFLRGCDDYFGNIIAEIDIFLFLKGCTCIGALHLRTLLFNGAIIFNFRLVYLSFLCVG